MAYYHGVYHLLFTNFSKCFFNKLRENESAKYRCLLLELFYEDNLVNLLTPRIDLVLSPQRRDDRVADCASPERMCGGNSTEGSNPSLSAIDGVKARGVNKG